MAWGSVTVEGKSDRARCPSVRAPPEWGATWVSGMEWSSESWPVSIKPARRAVSSGARGGVWPACSCGSLGLARAPELGDDRVQAAALDVLHHVEVDALVFADAMDGDDVGVVQPSGRLSLSLETKDIFRQTGERSTARL